MLCYRCGSQVADKSDVCDACGQAIAPLSDAGFGTRTRHSRVAAKASPLNVGDVLADRFEVLKEVGGGATGWVYKCVDHELDLDVALKVLSRGLLQTQPEKRRLSAQLSRVRSLVHDNIVRVYDNGEDGGHAFFSMQHVEALPLRRIWDGRRQKHQAFTLAEVNELVAQIADAVDYASEQGMGHGALKPDNILVLPDLVKVSDFGLADGLPRAPFVAAQESAGRGRYLAPEFLQGAAVDPRADVFSLGVIVGELLTGAPYAPAVGFDDRNAPLPEGITDLLWKATAEKPEGRFATAGAFAEALANAAPAPVRASVPEPADDVDVEEVEQSPDSVFSRPKTGPVAVSSDPAWTQGAGLKPLPTPIVLPPATERSSKAPMLVAGLLLLMVAGVFFYLAREGKSLGVADAEADEAVAAVEPEPVENEDREPEPKVRAEPETEVEKKPVAAAEPKPESKPRTAKPPAPPVESPSEKQRRAAERAEILREAEAREAKRRRDEALARLATTEESDADLRSAAFERAARAVDSTKATPSEPSPAPVEAKEPTCRAGMRLIPAGSFLFGPSGAGESTVTTAAYCIDLYEYPNKKGGEPGTNLRFAQAVSSCKSRGKRLCSEQEWERACKGPSNAHFPYGNTFNAEACNTADASGQAREIAASGSFSKCGSGYGVFDLSGNVAEWVDSPFGSGGDNTVKGGGANRAGFSTRCAARVGRAPGSKDPFIGFRCCSAPL